ncbi:MAG TPA: glucan ABC transporter ATP-binding protein/ permease [Polyangiaceae bacterium]|nr:glucan ABC transporter ATP-binding protein/ permease [Polyangiaceae bacterium]
MQLLRLYLRVLGRLGPERRLGALLGVANMLLAAVAFAEPVLFGRMIDALYVTGREPGEHGPPTRLFVAWGAFGLFTIGSGVYTALHADRLSHRRRLAVIADYFEHALRLPQSFHVGTHSGRVLKVMLDGAHAMWWFWLSLFRTHLAGLVTVVVLLPLTLLIDFRMGMLLVCLVAIFGIVAALVARKTEKLQRKVEEVHTELAERATDTISNIAVVQSFARIDAEVRALGDMIVRVLRAQIPVLSWWAVVSVATRTACTLTVLGIISLGVVLRFRGEISVGQIITFTTFSTVLIARLEQVVDFVNSAFSQAPKIRQFFEVVDTIPAVRDCAGARDAGRVAGTIRFEGVSFSYDGSRQAVQGLSFEVKRGETLALVGATGSGKSTTLSLLHRSFDPQSGRILVDGVDIRTLTLESLRRNIGVVFQEPMLFARTIRENVLVGRADATDLEVIAALARAQATDVMLRQPEGLDTVIAERGRSLSGGERQRLSIARALLKDPPILILDEATSALDAATEGKVKRALDDAMVGRTAFVIAHRLSTVRNATRIAVFDEGRIVEMGTFDELIARDGRFAELARAQFMVPDSRARSAE